MTSSDGSPNLGSENGGETSATLTLLPQNGGVYGGEEEEEIADSPIPLGAKTATLNSLDDVYTNLGGFGRFQLALYFFQGLAWVFCAANTLAMVFIGEDPLVTCPETGSTPYPASQAPCAPAAFTFLQPHGSIAAEWKLVGDRSYWVAWASSAYFMGWFVGCGLAGWWSDQRGRRPTLLIALSLAIATELLATLSTHLYQYIALRTLAGAAIGATGLISWILAAESWPPKRRDFWGCMFHSWFSVGIMAVAGIAGGVVEGDWRALMRAVSAPGVLLLIALYIWWAPESPRWLLEHGKREELQKALQRIARTNRVRPNITAWVERTLPHLFSTQSRHRFLSSSASNSHSSSATASKNLSLSLSLSRKSSMAQLFLHPRLRRYVLLQAYLWFATSFSYYGISLAADHLVGSLYLNAFLAGAVEIPAYAVAIPILSKGGRRKGTAMCLGLLGIAGVLCLWITGVGRTYLALTAKFSSSACFAAVYMYATELFPTAVRNAGVGVASQAARIGGIVAPLVVSLPGALPFICFGASALAATIVSLSLPETNGAISSSHVDIDDDGDRERERERERERDATDLPLHLRTSRRSDLNTTPDSEMDRHADDAIISDDVVLCGNNNLLLSDEEEYETVPIIASNVGKSDDAEFAV